MLTLKEIITRLQHHNLSSVSRAVNISRQTLSNIVNKKNKNPSYEVLEKLSLFLEGEN